MGRAKDPEVKKRLKTAFEYIEQKKEQSKRKTQKMKEGLHDTSWENDEGDKITLIDLLNATEDISVERVSVEELKPHLLSWDGDEEEIKKIEKSDLQYPILIFVDDNNEFISIIDGHHRAQKAARKGLKTIKAKLIPINSLPKNIRKVFSHMGRQEEMKEGELTEKCWPGYTQKGMKTMFGKRYPNCVKKTVKDLDEGEINWKKEKSWKIQDQFPIEVFVEKSWTGKYYVVKVPIMSMSYETFMDLDNFGKVDISTYDYENGEAKFTSYSLDNIKKWGENNKDKIHINYSRLMNEQISRIQSMMGLNEQGELDTLPKKYNPESILDFSNSKVKDIVWRAGNMELNPLNGGIWFGETKKGVENFAISVRGKVIEGKPYHINLENPFYFDSFWHGYVEEVKNSPNGRQTLMDKLKLEGYDGIIIDTDTWNDTGDEYAVTSKQYIVFYPENIKPA